MKQNRKKHLPLLAMTMLLAILLAGAFTLTGCGDEEDVADDEAVIETTVEVPDTPEEKEKEREEAGPENNWGALPGDRVEVDPYEAMSEEERAIVKKQSKKKNKDADNFIGKWKVDKETGYDLYGNTKIDINKDGTFKMDIGDEVFTATWKKTRDGIRYKGEVISGRIFYGRTGELIIDNDKWDIDDEETGIGVILRKVK